ncbi:MAG: hypothetical protein LBL15_08325 [Oscillospiraceae bacterium]|jgi:hypothetical protein|nr:hypothetical protein [Oscillospiraceae bacterium]
MKRIMRRIDRFCLTHPRFGLPNLMLYIVIGNAVVWLFGIMDTTSMLRPLLTFNAEFIFTRGEVWRLLSFVLIPEQDGFWLLIALYFYYWIGSALERRWGSGKFTIYYLIGMLLNILYGTLMWLVRGSGIDITASYINLSMFFSFATLYPDTVVLLFFVIPVKVKWLAYLDAAFFAFAVIFRPFPVNLLPVVAVLNYLLFCGGWLFDKLSPSSVKQRQKTVDFKNAARQYAREQASKPYSRKCEVCGRTDRDHPELEFRFCSRCAGYHCFCIDHINSHVHFRE